MYQQGLGLRVLSSFENHQGFDGVIIGEEGSDFHLEFTFEKGVKAPFCSSPEDLLVFYYSDLQSFDLVSKNLKAAGFKHISSHNPYWNDHGLTFEDPEGYRVVIVLKEN